MQEVEAWPALPNVARVHYGQQWSPNTSPPSTDWHPAGRPMQKSARGEGAFAEEQMESRDGRRAADTGEISRQVVDTSHVGELELLAGAETFCMNGRRNSALRKNVVADAAASRNSLALNGKAAFSGAGEGAG